MYKNNLSVTGVLAVCPLECYLYSLILSFPQLEKYKYSYPPYLFLSIVNMEGDNTSECLIHVGNHTISSIQERLHFSDPL